MLVAAVEKATENFIERGETIAYENPDIKSEMLSAVEEVRKTGIAFIVHLVIDLFMQHAFTSYCSDN